jgi:hypothetical protein
MGTSSSEPPPERRKSLSSSPSLSTGVPAWLCGSDESERLERGTAIEGEGNGESEGEGGGGLDERIDWTQELAAGRKNDTKIGTYQRGACCSPASLVASSILGSLHIAITSQ